MYAEIISEEISAFIQQLENEKKSHSDKSLDSKLEVATELFNNAKLLKNITEKKKLSEAAEHHAATDLISFTKNQAKIKVVSSSGLFSKLFSSVRADIDKVLDSIASKVNDVHKKVRASEQSPQQGYKSFSELVKDEIAENTQKPGKTLSLNA